MIKLKSIVKEIFDANLLENNVEITIYCDMDGVICDFEKQFIYLPFDTFKRNIASIMFIPSNEIFKEVLDHYDFSKNDMENFN